MRSRALVFSLLYTGVIAYLSLFPGEFLAYPRASGLAWTPLVGRKQTLDFCLNILLYAPLGLGLAWTLGYGWVRSVAACLIGVLWSASMETAQLWAPARFSTYTDLLSNSLGTLLGVVAARSLPARLIDQDSASLQHWKLRPQQAFFLVLWLAWRCFPFMPRPSWFVAVQQFTHPALGTWTEGVYSFAGFAVLATILGSPRWNVLAAATVLMAPFWEQHTLTLASIFGLGLGWLWSRTRPTRRGMAWVLLIIVLAEELRPFRFVTLNREFDWKPFESWFGANADLYYALIFSKLFAYTACAWAWRSGFPSYRAAAAVPLVCLFLTEWVQRSIPGRTPELTDCVLYLAGWILLVLLGEDKNPTGPRVQQPPSLSDQY